MSTYDLLERLLLALVIGLLIGIERGWQEREGPDGSRAAGVRTYALISLLGGLCALLATFVGDFFLGPALIAFAGCLALFEWREANASNSASATGTIAGLVTFALGAYSILGDMVVAGACAIAVTVVLAERKALHAFVENLKWSELRAGLLLLVMSFVFLPILPNYPVDPWNALNPRELWLMVVIIAALSFIGYVCVRVAGERAGLIFAAAAGGLISSTTVSWSYARLARAQPGSSMPLAAGVVVSWAVSLVRMSAIAITLAPGLFWPMASILGLPVVLLIGVTTLLYRRSNETGNSSLLVLENPFELSEVLKFGLLLASVTFVAKLVSSGPSQWELLPLAAVSGLVDVDPITLSTSRIAGHAITLPYAAMVIIVAGGANLFCKTVLGIALGSYRFAIYIAATSVAVTACGIALWMSFA